MKKLMLVTALKLALLLAPPQFHINWVETVKPTVAQPPVTGVVPVHRVIRVVIITSDGCRPCKIMLRNGGPIDDFRAQHRGRKGPQGETIEVQVVNKDLYPAVAAKYRVDGYPTIVILKDGQEVARRTGAVTTYKQLDELAGLPSGTQKYAEPTIWQRPVLTQQPYRGHRLIPSLRNAPALSGHMIRDHGYTPQQLRGKSYQQLLEIHDAVHGEELH